MFRGGSLPVELGTHLHALGYALEATRLLEGLPIVYVENDKTGEEYLDAWRIVVSPHEDVSPGGAFVRYRYEVVRELLSAQC